MVGFYVKFISYKQTHPLLQNQFLFILINKYLFKRNRV